VIPVTCDRRRGVWIMANKHTSCGMAIRRRSFVTEGDGVPTEGKGKTGAAPTAYGEPPGYTL
jgi:hypothetical protein